MINFGFILRRNNNGEPDFVVNFKKGKFSSFPFETKATFHLIGDRPPHDITQEYIWLDYDLTLSVSDTFLLPHKHSKENPSWRTFDDGRVVFKNDHIPLMHVVLNFTARVKVKGLFNHNNDSHLYGHKIDTVEMEFDNSIAVVESTVTDSTNTKEVYREYSVNLNSIIDHNRFFSKNEYQGNAEIFKKQIMNEREFADFLRSLKDNGFSTTNETFYNSSSSSKDALQVTNTVSDVPRKPLAFLKDLFL